MGNFLNPLVNSTLISVEKNGLFQAQVVKNSDGSENSRIIINVNGNNTVVGILPGDEFKQPNIGDYVSVFKFGGKLYWRNIDPNLARSGARSAGVSSAGGGGLGGGGSYAGGSGVSVPSEFLYLNNKGWILIQEHLAWYLSAESLGITFVTGDFTENTRLGLQKVYSKLGIEYEDPPNLDATAWKNSTKGSVVYKQIQKYYQHMINVRKFVSKKSTLRDTVKAVHHHLIKCKPIEMWQGRKVSAGMFIRCLFRVAASYNTYTPKFEDYNESSFSITGVGGEQYPHCAGYAVTVLWLACNIFFNHSNKLFNPNFFMSMSTASTQQLQNFATGEASRKLFYTPSEGYIPKRGDIIIFDGHTGNVWEDYDGSGTLQTIEGNRASRSHGSPGIRIGTRGFSQGYLEGFINIDEVEAGLQNI